VVCSKITFPARPSPISSHNPNLTANLVSSVGGVLEDDLPGEAVALAWLRQQSDQKRYAASACLYTDIFTNNPKLAANLDRQRRPGCRAR
jgi:hypothetical protein